MVEIPTADWSWINEAAERFEQAWKKGPRPRIEDFLAKVPEPGRPPLLSELLRVERELRARAGEGPTADEYRRRFPEHDDVVASVFASVPPKSGARTLPATEGAATTASRDPVSKLPPELANHPDYEIIRELGHGGMGVVFLAHNRIMGLDEVLKVIGPDIIESPGAFERFLREIRAVARLQHPNIVTAHSGFRCGESLVFAMEYVEGLDLARMVMAKGPMPVKHASYFVHQAALGLQHAHEDGMVHRDIKPGNLMLTHKRGKAVIKVLDFGLAKAEREQMVLDPVPSGANRDLSAAGGLTRPEEMLGTPDFIAPEQIVDSRRADIRADIYSLGCTLYYLLSGRAPFQAASIRETLQAHRSMDARLLNLVRPEVPAELAALVAKMMAKEPDRRFQTPSDVAIALAPFFKNPTAAAASPNAGVDQDLVPDAVRVAPVSASETGHGMWSSLIDFRETEDDEDASEAEPARVRPQWLWPAVAAGLLFCGLIAAGGVGIVKSVLVKKDGVELAGAEVSIGTEESERLVASKPRKAPGPVAEPSPGSEALRPNPDTSAPAQLSREIAGEMPPPVAEPLPGNKAPPPKSDTPTPAQVFQKITAIPTPDLVLQARLIFNSGRVLFETGGRNRALWRGDLSNPQKPRKLKASVPGWVHLAISSNGGFAVLATENSLWNWDLQADQSGCILRPGRANITAIALSPDHQVVAYVRGGAIQVCDAITGARGKKKEFDGPTGSRAELIAFSPDGRRIVSTHGDRSIRVWEVKTGLQIGRRSETPNPVSGLAVFPDGRRVLISLSGPTFVWDLETNRQLRQAPGFGESIALSTDGLRALIGGGNFMRLWDLVTGDELVREDHKRAVRHVAFSSDDCQALSSTDESVHVWALPPGRAAGEQPPVVEVAEFPRHGGIHLSVDVSRDGRWVLTGDWPNSVRLWDREKGQLIREFNQGGRPITSVAFSRDGTLALAGGDDGVVRLWDLRSGEHRELTRHVDHVMSVAFSPDGRRAYSAGGILPGLKDGTDFAVRVWDLETGQQLRPFEGHKAAVWSVAVSPDGRYVLSGGNDAVPILWDARTGREIHRLKGHADRVVCVAFLPDGRVVSSGDDGTIRLWDVENGREFLGHFKDPTGLTEPLAVSRDGHRLFSSGEHQLRYWNLDTGRLIQKLKWEESPVGGSFTPDGRHVVWGGWGSLLRMYRLADIPERPIAPPRRSPNTKSRSGLKPTEEASHTDLAKALRGQGKLEEAIAEYKTAIGINPDDANPHNGLGNALHKQGKLAEAIAEYREALRLKPEFADAYRNLGKALQDQGLLAEAIIEYKAIQLKPDDALAHSRLGYALHAQGSLAEAIIKYKEAIRLKPDDAKTLNNLAWALVLYPKRPRPDYDEALMHSRRAVELAPDWANLNTLALAEYRSGHWAESLAASERSMALNNGGNAWDWFLEAMARCQKGDKDEARKWLDTAVASDPKTKNVELRQFWAEAAELLGRSGPGASAAGSPAAPAAEKPR